MNGTPDAESPVFIGGTQRSGTSLLRSLIDSNTEVFFEPAEMKFFVRYFYRLSDYEPLSDPAKLGRFLSEYWDYRRRLHDKLDREAFQTDMEARRDLSWADVYGEIMRCLAALENRRRWGDKSPGTEFFTDQILEFYPKARILCTIRDPRAVMASSTKRYRKHTLNTLLRWQLSARRMMSDAQRLPKESYLLVFYEDLVLHLEETMDQVFRFLEVEPARPLDALEINAEKWGRGGETSFKDKEKPTKQLVWKDSLTAYKKVLNGFDLKMVDWLLAKDCGLAGYDGSVRESERYYDAFVRKLQGGAEVPAYHPRISAMLNRVTDKKLREK